MGFRIFTGGSTKSVDASTLDDERSYPVWALCSEHGIPICIQTDASGIPATIALAKRFPSVPIIIDHFARPDVSDGPPYAKAAPLMSLAGLQNVYLKLTPVALDRLRQAKADAHAFLAKVVAEFGATRIAWGSNWPNSPGTLKEHVAAAKAALAPLSEVDRDAILGGTALRLYPALNKN
jgi:L-fuconolactonase